MKNSSQRHKKRKNKRKATTTLRPGSGTLNFFDLELPLNDPPLPGSFMMEQVMNQMFGARGEEDPHSQAQHLAFRAMETPDRKTASKFISQALELDPHNIDALLERARILYPNPRDRAAEYRRIIGMAEKDLGTKFFKEYKGEFWGLLETRPYMRARQFLGDLLLMHGKPDEAIPEYEKLLELNPHDNQGVRYSLLGLYLRSERIDDARRLFQTYDDEWSAQFAWSKVFERFISGDTAGAAKALSAARKMNKHVEAYLTSKSKLPDWRPELYSPGDKNEAILCAFEIGPAWWEHKDAIEWLISKSR